MAHIRALVATVYLQLHLAPHLSAWGVHVIGPQVRTPQGLDTYLDTAQKRFSVRWLLGGGVHIFFFEWVTLIWALHTELGGFYSISLSISIHIHIHILPETLFSRPIHRRFRCVFFNWLWYSTVAHCSIFMTFHILSYFCFPFCLTNHVRNHQQQIILLVLDPVLLSICTKSVPMNHNLS